MATEKGRRSEKVVTLFLQKRSPKDIAVKLGMNEDDVNSIIQVNKQEIEDIVNDLDSLKIIRDEKGKMDVEEMMVQLNHVTLNLLREHRTALEPREVLMFLGEARRQLELQAKVQGKFNIMYGEGQQQQQVIPTDFKQFLIQNLTVIANSKDVQNEQKKIN